MPFVEFTRTRPIRAQDRPLFRIGKDGKAFLNRPCLLRYGLSSGDVYRVLVDADAGMIALEIGKGPHVLGRRSDDGAAATGIRYAIEDLGLPVRQVALEVTRKAGSPRLFIDVSGLRGEAPTPATESERDLKAAADLLAGSLALTEAERDQARRERDEAESALASVGETRGYWAKAYAEVAQAAGIDTATAGAEEVRAHVAELAASVSQLTRLLEAEREARQRAEGELQATVAAVANEQRAHATRFESLSRIADALGIETCWAPEAVADLACQRLRLASLEPTGETPTPAPVDLDESGAVTEPPAPAPEEPKKETPQGETFRGEGEGPKSGGSEEADAAARRHKLAMSADSITPIDQADKEVAQEARLRNMIAGAPDFDTRKHAPHELIGCVDDALKGGGQSDVAKRLRMQDARQAVGVWGWVRYHRNQMQPLPAFDQREYKRLLLAGLVDGAKGKAGVR